jgi:hypothetical protein
MDKGALALNPFFRISPYRACGVVGRSPTESVYGKKLFCKKEKVFFRLTIKINKRVELLD